MNKQQPEALRLTEIARYCFRSEGMSDPPEQFESPTGDMVDYFDHVEIEKALLARITELESQLAQRFDAADMATAAAQGFRDGVASLSANAGEPRNAIDRDALIDAIAQGLHGTWHCTRAWEAWHVGTMSQDDFEPVDESETPTEIADAVLALLAAPPAAQALGCGAEPPGIQALMCVISSLRDIAHFSDEEGGELMSALCALRDWAHAQPAPATQQGVAYAALPDERAAFEAQFPVPGGVHWDGTEYVVKDSHVSSYRCNRFEGQWEAWKARASHGQAPAETGNSVSAQADSVQEDAARLDHLHSTGSTIEMLPGEVDFYPMRFRVGGLHSAVSPNLREAIDAARKQGEKQ